MVGSKPANKKRAILGIGITFIVISASFSAILFWPAKGESDYEVNFSELRIWGADPNAFYVVGYMDEMLMRCSHDPNTDFFNFVLIPVSFSGLKSMEPAMSVDKFGRPLN